MKKAPRAFRAKKKVTGAKKAVLPKPFINMLDDTNREFLAEVYQRQIPLLKAH